MRVNKDEDKARLTTNVFIHFHSYNGAISLSYTNFRILDYPWNMPGIIPLITGITLNLIADAAFKREQTTVKPFEKSTALVETGVFQISRHPMYLNMVLILLGIAILMGSLTPFIVVAIFGLLMELVFVKTEERMLEEQFGPPWVAYKKKVRKWV